jgi:hypothetical protein
MKNHNNLEPLNISTILKLNSHLALTRCIALYFALKKTYPKSARPESHRVQRKFRMKVDAETLQLCHKLDNTKDQATR